MHLETCLLNFPVATSTPSYEYEGVSSVAVGIVYDMDLYAVQKNSPNRRFLTPAIQKRVLEIEHCIIQLATQLGIPCDDLRPLDHGRNAVVLQIYPGYVIRIQRGRLPERPGSAYILHAFLYFYSPEQNLTYEILPRLKTGNVTQAEAEEISLDIRKEGIVLFDLSLRNFGRDETGKLFVLDPDSYYVAR